MVFDQWNLFGELVYLGKLVGLRPRGVSDPAHTMGATTRAAVLGWFDITASRGTLGYRLLLCAGSPTPRRA